MNTQQLQQKFEEIVSQVSAMESYHHRLREALGDVTKNLEHARMIVPDAQVSSMLFDSTQEARALLAELNNLESSDD